MTISLGLITGMSVGIELLGPEHGFKYCVVFDLLIVRLAFYRELEED